VKYKIIEDDIIEQINSRRLMVGDYLAQTDVLAKEYNVSKLTVDKALTNLANSGYLKRIKRKGTIVFSSLGHKFDQPMKHLSLSQEIRSNGMEPGSRLLEYKIVVGSDVPDVAQAMLLKPSAMLHYFARVRTGNGVPVALSYSYMTVKQIPYIDINVLDKGSLWEYLSNIGFDGTRTSYYNVKIVKADEFRAIHLDVPVDAPLLFSHHISVMRDGTVYNYVDNYFVSERFEYKYAAHVKEGEK